MTLHDTERHRDDRENGQNEQVVPIANESPSVQMGEGAKVTPYREGNLLEGAKGVYRKWLELPDESVIDFMFGVVFAHRLGGDPVWGGIVGASGDTKTELLRTLSHPDRPEIKTLSTLTPNTLISGLPARMNNGKEPSLLDRLDGKILVIKDLTPIISGSRDARSAILGQLRDAYDGSSAKSFGTGEDKEFHCRFGLLFGVTPAIEGCWPIINQLGERFIYYRCLEGNSLDKVAAALKNSNHKKEMRAELTAAAQRVLTQTVPQQINVPRVIEDRIMYLADFVATARTPVKRAGRTEEVEYMPSPEVGTRLGGQFIQLVRGIAAARGCTECDDSVMSILNHVARSGIPHARWKAIELLAGSDGLLKSDAVGQALTLGSGTIRRTLEDLWLLKLVVRETSGGSYQWRLSDLARNRLEKSGLGTV